MLKFLPNLLTIVRIIIVLPFIILLYREYYLGALIVLFAAGMSDGLDGFLARRFGWESRFGSIADPIADKLLLVSSYIVLGLMGHIPVLLMVVVVARDVIIVLAATLYWHYIGHFEGQPTMLGKLCTFAMIVQAIMVLSSLALIEISAGLLNAGGVLVVLLCLMSGVQYMYKGYLAASSAKRW